MQCDVIVGMQWGSEGKGKIAAMLALEYDASVRVGGPNAGHTVIVNGKPRVTRHLPAAVVNRDCRLYLGAGACIDLAVLEHELDEWADYDAAARLTIDPRASLVWPHHREQEQKDCGWMGSTCKGGGAALIDKIRRHTSTPPIDTTGPLRVGSRAILVADVRTRLEQHSSVLVEGTQGVLLSLDHGDWPWVTARNVTPSAILGDIGIGPRDVRRVYGVLRTYPIRVGGPSGPMPGEITWEELAAESGKPIDPERTTVTQRPRRIARIDWAQLQRAQRLTGAHGFVVTFLDYIRFESEQARFLLDVQKHGEAPVVGASYGPAPEQGWVN